MLLLPAAISCKSLKLWAVMSETHLVSGTGLRFQCVRTYSLQNKYEHQNKGFIQEKRPKEI